MKHRLLEFLASEMGFTIFSMEASTPEAYRINDYVLEGQGDPKSLIGGMYFWTWNTVEVHEMVEWMREFNASGKGPVQFTGFDMQTPHVAMEIVTDFLAQVDSMRATEVKTKYCAIKNVRAGSPFGVATFTDPDVFDLDFEKGGVSGAYLSNDASYKATLDSTNKVSGEKSLCIRFLGVRETESEGVKEAVFVSDEILTHFEESRYTYLNQLPAKEVEWAIHNARIVHECMRMRARVGKYVRDEAMANNVTWILEQNPGAKIVLWAHNAHIARKPGAMGYFLDEEYGDDYLPIAFAANGGSYTAISEDGLGTHELQEPPEDSVERAFVETGKARLILDLRRATAESEASGGLTESRPFRLIGAMAMEEQFDPVSIAKEFDLLVYFETTSAAVQLDTRPAGKR
jgi:erythromycin esterase